MFCFIDSSYRFSIFDYTINMDLYVLALAVILVVVILALLSCFLLTGREKSFEEVMMERKGLSVLLRDQHDGASAKKSGGSKKEKKKKAKDSSVTTVVSSSQHQHSFEDKASASASYDEAAMVGAAAYDESQHSTSLRAQDSMSDDDVKHSDEGMFVVSTSTSKKSRKGKGIGGKSGGTGSHRQQQRLQQQSHSSEDEEKLLALGSTYGEEPVVAQETPVEMAVDEDVGGESHREPVSSEDYGVSDIPSSMTRDQQDDMGRIVTESLGTEVRKRSKKSKSKGSAKIAAEDKVATSNGAVIHDGMSSSEVVATAPLYSATAGVGTLADDYDESVTVDKIHQVLSSSDSNVIPEEPKPTSKHRKHTSSEPSDERLKLLLEELRVMEINESEVQQVIHVLTEKHSHTMSWVKASGKPDPQIANLKKQISDKDEQLNREQIILQQANKKLKELAAELNQEKSRNTTFERSFRDALQQKENQLQVKLQEVTGKYNQQVQECQTKIMSMQKIIEQQGQQAAQQPSPQALQQLRDENQRLKERASRFDSEHGRINTELQRLQSELAARDAQIKQGMQENTRLKDQCKEFENREKRSISDKGQQMKALSDQLTERDHQANEFRVQVERLNTELTTVRTQLDAERMASQKEITELNQRMESAQSVQTIQHVSAPAPVASSGDCGHGKELDQLRNEVTTVKAANERLFAELGEANKGKSDAEKRIEEMNETLGENDRILTELKAQLTSLETASDHFSQTDAENTRLRDELSRLKADVEARDGRIKDLTSQCDELTRSSMDGLSSYRRDLETWQQEKLETAARLTDIQARLDAKEKEYKDEVGKLKQRLDDTVREKQQLLNKETSSEEARHKEMENIMNSKNSLEAEMSVVQSQLSESVHAQQEMTAELNRVRKQLTDSQKKVDGLESQLQEAILSQKNTEAEKQNLQLEISSVKELEKELDKLRSQISELESSKQRVMAPMEQPVSSMVPDSLPEQPAAGDEDGLADISTTFEWVEPYGNRVQLTGSFFDWGEPRDLEEPWTEDGVRSLTVPLQPGRYEFKFLVDGNWTTSSAYPTAETGLGSDTLNNYVIVEAAPVTNGEIDRFQIDREAKQKTEAPTHLTLAPKTDLAKLQEKIQVLQTENANLKQQITTAAATVSNGVASESEVLVSTSVSTQSASPLTSNGDISLAKETERTISALNEKLVVAEEEIKQLREQLAVGSGRLVPSGDELESLRNRNAHLRSQVSEYRTEYARTKFGLSQEEIDKYKTCFDLFDKDGDGTITKAEISDAIQACGLKPNSNWIQDLLAEADDDGSGTIEWSEFLKAMTGLTEEARRETQQGSVSTEQAPSENVETVEALKAVKEELDIAQEEISKLQTEMETTSRNQSATMSNLQSQVQQLGTANDQLEARLSKYRTYYAEAVYGLSQDSVNKYRKVFDVLDVNNNGCIAKSEIESAIQTCGLKPSSRWVQELLREADESGTDIVEWPAFLRAVSGMSMEQGAKQETEPKVESTSPSSSSQDSAAVQELQESVTDLTNKLTDREKQIEELKVNVESYQQQIQSFQENIPSINVTRYTSVEGLPSPSNAEFQRTMEELSEKDKLVEKLQEDLKKQQDKNNELRRKNYKAVEAANQVEKVAQEVSAKATKQLQEKYQQELDEQRKLTQELLTVAFPNVKIPHKTETYREWLHEFQKVVKKEVQREIMHTHTESTKVIQGPASSKELEVRVESLNRANGILESQLAHYKSILAQTEGLLKALESTVKDTEDHWNTKCQNYEQEVQMLQKQLAIQSSSSPSSSASFEEKIQIDSLETRLKKSEETWKRRCESLEHEIEKLRSDKREIIKEIHTVEEIRSQVTVLETKLIKEETEKTILMKEVQQLSTDLEVERQTGKDLSAQAVKLRGMLKTGQDALKQEQEHVYLLQGQLKELQATGVEHDVATLKEKLDETQKQLEKELMVNKQISNKLESLGVIIDTE